MIYVENAFSLVGVGGDKTITANLVGGVGQNLIYPYCQSFFYLFFSNRTIRSTRPRKRKNVTIIYLYACVNIENSTWRHVCFIKSDFYLFFFFFVFVIIGRRIVLILCYTRSLIRNNLQVHRDAIKYFVQNNNIIH